VTDAMSEAHLPYGDFQKALQVDLRSVVQLSRTYPIGTLAYLDAMLRGFLEGPHTPEQIHWLVDADRTIRRTLGSRQRNADLAILRAAYRQSALYLVLGAGMSQGAGLPGWKDLVIDVLDHALHVGTAPYRDQMAPDPRRAPAELPAGPVEHQVPKELSEVIPISDDLGRRLRAARQALQRAAGYTSADLVVASQAASEALGRHFPYALRTLLYQRAIKESRALDAMPALVRPRGGQWGGRARLSAIITFNYDDLVERTLTRAGIATTAHASVHGQWKHMAGWITDRESAIDIYHVHGYAPDSPADVGNVDFVLTEEQYAKIYTLENGLARGVQRAFLTKSLGLILGSSLSDEYALNELRAAHAENPGWYNYAMMRDTDPRSKEDYARLGLRVLWYRDRDEIAQLLEQLAADSSESFPIGS
jgi:hypothetical protein